MKAFSTSSPAPVRSALLQLLEVCNFRCRHCSQDAPLMRADDAQHWLPPDDARARVGLLRALGLERVRFTGGEPLLYPWLVDIVQFAGDLGIQTSLVTNGSMLAAQAASLAAAGIQSVWISLYGPNQRSYLSVAGRNPVDSALVGVRRLTSSSVSLGVYCAADLTSLSEVDLVQDFISAGVSHVKFLQLLEHGRYTKSAGSRALLDVRAGLRAIKTLADGNPTVEVKVSLTSAQLRDFVDEGWQVPSILGCGAGGPDSWAISRDGVVYPCCLLLRSTGRGEPASIGASLSRGKAGDANHLENPCRALPDYQATVDGDFVCPLLFASPPCN